MPVNADLLTRLRDSAGKLDQSGEWPHAQFQWLADAGILSWVIPRKYAGLEVPQLELMDGYEALAGACLNTAFILTQRNGACQRIAGCSNESLKQKLLPQLARGETFATVGISHLTTSRQYLRTPAVQAELREERIRVTGTVPWVTGAAQAQYIVTGGTCADGRQILLALPTLFPGVSIQPHAQLMALTASHTASVNLDNVLVPVEFLLAGPIPEVMKLGQGGGTGSQVTSMLALGLSARIVTLIQEQARIRPDLQFVADQFETELARLRNDLFRSVSESPADYEALVSVPVSAAEIRQRANSLVLRITQVAMAICKGAGYLQGHPAEIACREALFFLVWSCPQPVVQNLLEELAKTTGSR